VCLYAVLLAGCSSGDKPAPAKEAPASQTAPAVKITQFYANPPSIPRGEKSLLCYGVEGASAVRIEPPVEQLSPALTRCFEVTPKAPTTYKLIAQGRGGGHAEQTITVDVGGARPVLFDLSVNSTAVKPGQLVSFCFQSKNASAVRGSPGRFQRGGSVGKDCLVDQPDKTTTYEIVVSNAQGLTDRATMTVEVKR
jgi:hypothetical protein